MELEIFKAYHSLLDANLYITGTEEEWLAVTNGLSDIKDKYGSNPLTDALEIGVFKYIELQVQQRKKAWTQRP